MKVEEIIALVETQVEENYDFETWLGLINACLQDLTPIAKMVNVDEKSIAGSDPETVDFGAPLDNIHEVLNVHVKPTAGVWAQFRKIPMGNNYSRGWKLVTGGIVLQGNAEAGDVRVEYYANLEIMEGSTDEPDLPGEYHHLIVLYLCAFSKLKEEELDNNRSYYAQYLAGKQQMAVSRIWEMEPQNRRRIRQARLGVQVGTGGRTE